MKIDFVVFPSLFFWFSVVALLCDRLRGGLS